MEPGLELGSRVEEGCLLGWVFSCVFFLDCLLDAGPFILLDKMLL